MWPSQFSVIQQNMRCSILFHLLISKKGVEGACQKFRVHRPHLGGRYCTPTNMEPTPSEEDFNPSWAWLGVGSVSV